MCGRRSCGGRPCAASGGGWCTMLPWRRWSNPVQAACHSNGHNHGHSNGHSGVRWGLARLIMRRALLRTLSTPCSVLVSSIPHPYNRVCITLLDELTLSIITSNRHSVHCSWCDSTIITIEMPLFRLAGARKAKRGKSMCVPRESVGSRIVLSDNLLSLHKSTASCNHYAPSSSPKI